ncbi:MAG TPA: helix-turn-helix domain-containing protein [Porticoccaceae bacterium]
MTKATEHAVIALIDELIRSGSRLRSIFAHVTDASGLNAMQSAVLTAVAEARTPPTVPRIGRSLGHPRQVIQRAVNVLHEKQLIETIANPDHKRAPLLRITAEGRAIKDAMDARAIAEADRLLLVLDRDHCRRLAEDLRNLRGEIETFLRREERQRGDR